ncbi:MAG: type III-B CRISPR module RAMP protein Cmr6 [Gammaproteobacteria bacterium]|nr:type III-B CRISPR module RAMP protein Cmr6 [Gammaproteobacteria bacterium]
MKRRAALPRYVPVDDLRECPPGHRFDLYCKLWDENWSLERDEKKAALKDCCGRLSKAARELAAALRERQHLSLGSLPAALEIPARSTGPFVTGLGLEHPTEIGFAFLAPYGLPYLPGSSVKGVVRRAMEERILEGAEQGPDIAALWWLFGLDAVNGLLAGIEPDTADELFRLANSGPGLVALAGSLGFGSNAEGSPGTRLVQALKCPRRRAQLRLRGCLSFFDVFPSLRGERLEVDILTPHYTHYYQDAHPPHDAGQLNPLPFLVIGPGAEFKFYLSCDSGRLPEYLRERWRDWMVQAFEHAFNWLGFGAKGALGYGQMRLDRAALDELDQARAERERKARRQDEVSLLPGDAAWLQLRADEGCFADNNRLLGTLKPWLEEREALSPEAKTFLRDRVERTWPGILANPDAVRGKKKKPKFSASPVALAKRLLSLGVPPP